MSAHPEPGSPAAAASPQAEVRQFSLQNFQPAWGAVVMGTSVVSTVFAALRNAGVLVGFTSVLAVIFLILAYLVGVVILSVTTLRWLKHRTAAAQDLAHPVKGGMSATFGGGFLTLAVATGNSGSQLFGESAASLQVAILATIGGVLALVFGVVFLSGIFTRGQTPAGQITGVWFIPPVVMVITPAALAPLITSNQPVQRELLWILWMILGIGTLLYIAITAVLIFRSATAPLPPAPLAPSLLIGIGPAGLISLDLILLTEASARAGVISTQVLAIAQFAALALWGFGFWWLITGIVVIVRGYRTLKFSLSSWGFTFPLGAWAVAGIVLGSQLASPTMMATATVGAVALTVIWARFAVQTIQGLRHRTIWG